jgi:hypothetical protein
MSSSSAAARRCCGRCDDALTWRLDPGADRADELAKGKIMFLSGRTVGRVLDLKATTWP